MRAARNVQLYSIILLFLSTFTAAWPWPRWLPELDSLVVRQDSGEDSTSTTPKATQTQSSSPAETNKVSTTIKSLANTKSTSGTQSGTGTKTNSQSKSKATTSTTQKTYDARLPAGGISMITPAPLSGSAYFKIGDYVTFAWNYTSLSSTPSYLNIMATCTANQQLYTIAANQTVGNATGAVTWDTGAYQQTALADPLLTEIYTLIIYDAASSISATAQAGYLSVFNSYSFGMYVPQAYTPLGEFICATCSGAMSDMERRALGMVIGVVGVTVLSFTWFVSGTGVIW